MVAYLSTKPAHRRPSEGAARRGGSSGDFALSVTDMSGAIDSHAHLDHPDLRDDVEGILERARGVGLTQILTVASTLESSRACIALAEQHAELFATVGIHPHDAAAAGADDLQRVEELTGHPRVAAVGETGLDYHYDFSPRPVQRDLFARHVELALRVQKPLVIHLREAHDDALAILEPGCRRGARGVVHCFTGDRTEAERWVTLGLYISFSGIVTFPKSRSIQEAAAWVPADRILVETDAPYLAPVPHRGKRNEPAFVVRTAEHVAKLRGVPPDELLGLAAENTRRLFALPADRQLEDSPLRG
jgi:TatD DNase family protein